MSKILLFFRLFGYVEANLLIVRELNQIFTIRENVMKITLNRFV